LIALFQDNHFDGECQLHVSKAIFCENGGRNIDQKQRRLTFGNNSSHSIVALSCCVRPNPAASIFRAVRVNQRVVLSGVCWANYTAAGLRRCAVRYLALPKTGSN